MNVDILRRLYSSFPVVFLGILAIAAHLFPFLKFGTNPLGYDTGFYRRYLIEPFISFPNTSVPGLGDDALVPRLILDIGRLLHIPTDMLLYGSYLCWFILLPILFYIFLKQTLGHRTAYIAALLIIFSSVSYNAYWYMLWKNAWALDLLLISFIYIGRRNLLWVYIAGTALAFSHKTTTILYLVILATHLVIERDQRRELFFHAAWISAIFLIANVPLVHSVSIALPVALFMDWPEYLRFSAPLLLLIVCGWRAFLPQKLPRALIALTIVAFMFTIFHLPFYQRIFIYCDLALVALAAVALTYLLTRIKDEESTAKRLFFLSVVCVSCGIWLGNFWNQANSLRPLMQQNDIDAIRKIEGQLPEGAYLLTTSNEAPWFEGWTNAHIIAPGLLHDTHNFEEWNAFWNATSTQEKRVFINSFNKPLYVSTFGDPEVLLGSIGFPCLKEISRYIYKSECSSAQNKDGTLLATEAHPIDAIAAGVYNLSTGASWSWNGDEEWPLASLTKVMTALVAKDLIKSTQTIQITNAAEATLRENLVQPTFTVGDTLYSRDLIKAMLIVSSNDAAESLATFYGYDAFIAAMNRKAQALGMNHTLFVSASGLSPKNVSTTKDLVLLMKYISVHEPQLLAPTRLASSSIPVANKEGTRQVPLVNINGFAASSTFLGGKTGSLPQADQNLISIFATKHGPQVIIVLGAHDRFGETEKILREVN